MKQVEKKLRKAGFNEEIESGQITIVYENHELCYSCGGKCCRRMSGETIPADFGKTEQEIFDNLVENFRSGKWVVDWWEGDPRDGMDYGDDGYIDRCYYIRPRILNDSENNIYCAGWGGQCIFWTNIGCELEPNERPNSCKMLEPRPNGKCKMHDGGGKHKSALAWLLYQDLIKRAARVLT